MQIESTLRHKNQVSTWFEVKNFCLHTAPADLKCALEMDKTTEVEPQRTIDEDRREEVYSEIRVDFEERCFLTIAFPSSQCHSQALGFFGIKLRR